MCGCGYPESASETQKTLSGFRLARGVLASGSSPSGLEPTGRSPRVPGPSRSFHYGHFRPRLPGPTRSIAHCGLTYSRVKPPKQSRVGPLRPRFRRIGSGRIPPAIARIAQKRRSQPSRHRCPGAMRILGRPRALPRVDVDRSTELSAPHRLIPSPSFRCSAVSAADPGKRVSRSGPVWPLTFPRIMESFNGAAFRRNGAKPMRLSITQRNALFDCAKWDHFSTRAPTARVLAACGLVTIQPGVNPGHVTITEAGRRWVETHSAASDEGSQ